MVVPLNIFIPPWWIINSNIFGYHHGFLCCELFYQMRVFTTTLKIKYLANYEQDMTNIIICLFAYTFISISWDLSILREKKTDSFISQFEQKYAIFENLLKVKGYLSLLQNWWRYYDYSRSTLFCCLHRAVYVLLRC